MFFASSAPTCHVTIPSWHVFSSDLLQKLLQQTRHIASKRNTFSPEPDFKLTLTILHIDFKYVMMPI